MKKSKGRRIRSSVLTAFALLLLSVGVLLFMHNAFAETKKSLEEATQGGSFTAVMMQGTEPMTSPATLNYGDEVNLEFVWTFLDTTKIDAGDVLEYTLPNAIVFDEAGGDIMKGATKVGTFTVHENKISVTYTDAQFCKGTGRSSNLLIAGKINGTGVSPTERSKVKIDLPGNVSYELDVIPPSATPAMELTKTFENSKTQAERDAHIYDCYITVNMLGEHENPFIGDDMYPGMSVYGDTVDLCTDPNYSNPYGGTYSFDINAAKDSFRLNLTGTLENRRFYVHYRVQVRDEMYAADTAKAFAANYPKHYDQGYEGRIPNYAYAKSAKMTEDAHVWANIYTLESPFEKWANDSENDTEKGLLSWSFFIEKMADSVKNAYIVDNIPPNNSVVISSMRIHNSTDPDLTPVSDYLLFKEYTEGGQKKLKITFTDAFLKVLKDHSMEITFSIPVYNNMPASAVPEPGKCGSPNPYLSTLTVKTADGKSLSLNASFSCDVFEYTVTVPSGTKELSVAATAVVSGTKVTGTGKKSLTGNGDEIVVTTVAENGARMNYRIRVKYK
ncbi:MAG: cadherin-like beta sandwich domain-containing protein [Lachnospiraceae bacterium]|nr:cadherin-like beta sandwich domain-containing protein [Lachnospiraceae bacterium]